MKEIGEKAIFYFSNVGSLLNRTGRFCSRAEPQFCSDLHSQMFLSFASNNSLRVVEGYSFGINWGRVASKNRSGAWMKGLCRDQRRKNERCDGAQWSVRTMIEVHILTCLYLVKLEYRAWTAWH